MLARPSILARSAFASTGRRHASHGPPPMNPPSGYLFGEKPPPPGQKRQRESWELMFYTGMGGFFLFYTLVYIYKPDTSIQTWALNEAKQRMEARGDLPKYIPPHERNQ